MNIVVCIKQVPDAKDIQWTVNNTMKREGVESIINPCDLYAIEAALMCKKINPDAHITAITMGPQQAEKILRQAIALGCDDAYLICDKKFSGSDTLATGKTLASAIRKIAPNYDLVFCGQFASDGDTAQTGAEIAENLNAYQVTYATKVIDFAYDFIKLEQETENHTQDIQTPLPCVVCTSENKNIELSNALILGQIKAQDAQITQLTLEDLDLCAEEVGIKGSPTYVSNVFRPIHNRKGEIINPNNTIDFCKTLIDEVIQA